MITFKGQIQVGGSVVDVTAGPWELSKWEEYAARHNLSIETAPITFAMYISYVAIHREEWPPKIGYEAWAKDVGDVQAVDVDEVPPTEKASTAA